MIENGYSKKLMFLSMLMTLNVAFAKPLTEDEKIIKLISYVEHLQGVVFIRNGSQYTAKEAADHLTMKRSKSGNRVKIASDFIKNVASKSSVSGTPYQIKFVKDGKTVNCEDLLNIELIKLNAIK
jgi:hypothetical protein